MTSASHQFVLVVKDLVDVDFLQERVWGVAYEIRKEDVDSVCRHLDYREKDGYQRQRVTFYHPHADNG